MQPSNNISKIKSKNISKKSKHPDSSN